MSKEIEEVPGEISENDRKPELEKLVAYFTALAGPQRKVKKKYTPNKYPKFKDRREEIEYQVQEITRLETGFDGLNGKTYGWLNYAKLRDPERGKISPDFRTIDLSWFEKIEANQKSKSRGIVCIKRRRVGASSKEAWDAEHDCMINNYFQIGMNSRSEAASRDLFKHVKFIHQNLPDWLRPRATITDKRDALEFGWYEKDASGNKIKKGRQSWINCVAPTDSGHEGQAYSKLIIDEAGKIPNLLTIWGYAEDCLKLNTRRVGLPIIFGTVGDIDKDGLGLKEMWEHHEAYNLDQFAFWGYNGLMCDEFGNDRVEEAIRWIIYERERLKAANKKIRESFLQKYPLCEKDAFNQTSNGGVGDIELINDQLTNLIHNPPECRIGWMRKKPDGVVDFVPNPDGQIIIYELPDHARKNGYTAVVDPADDDDITKSRDTSELGLAITAKSYGLEPPKIVVEYAHRPLKLDEFFEQTAMVLSWYNKTKFLPELNKGGWRMLKYFEQHYPHLLALAPKSFNSAKGGVALMYGVKMTEARKQQMMGLIEDYVDNYCKFIPSKKLLDQFKVFGDKHADDDLAIAFGWCLIVMQADKTVVKTGPSDPAPNAGFKKTNGVIHFANKPLLTNRSKFTTNSALFKR